MPTTLHAPLIGCPRPLSTIPPVTPFGGQYADHRDRVAADRAGRTGGSGQSATRSLRAQLAGLDLAEPARALRGILFDLPHVVADAPKTLTEKGVMDRVDCLGGDFFESVPGGADSYLLSFVIHDWPDDAARRILGNIAAASGSGARLMMIEFVVPPGDSPHMSKMIDLTMLGMLAGRERPEEDWRELLTSAGFTGIGVLPTGTPLSVIHATVR